MKKLTILDESFISSECAAVKALEEASKLINNTTTPVSGIVCAESEEIRFCPAYIQLKAEINPVETINEAINACISSIGNCKKEYTIESAGKLSAIYNKLFNIETSRLSAIEEAATIFGGIDSISFDTLTESISVSEVNSFRAKVGEVRALASGVLSELNEAARVNDEAATKAALGKVILIKEFVKSL